MFAQNKKIDSLQILLKIAIPDTNKVKHSLQLGLEYRKVGNYDTAEYYTNVGLQLAHKLNFKKGVSKSYMALGLIYFYQEDYPKTLEYLLKAFKMPETLNDPKQKAKLESNIGVVYMKQGNFSKSLDWYFMASRTLEKLEDKDAMAANLGNIGLAYWNEGDFPKALEYYFKALKIAEQIVNKNAISINLGNIGLVYWKQNAYDQALDYYTKALRIDEELNDKNSQVADLGNIGLVYCDQGNYKLAMDFFLKALKIAEELDNKSGIATNLSNIGLIYHNKKDYSRALEYYSKSLKINEELGFESQIALCMYNIGSIYTLTGKYKKAEQFLKKARVINKNIGALDGIRNCEENLSQLYDTIGEHKLALIHYKKAKALESIIFSQENKKQIVQKEMQFNFDKKEAENKAETDKHQAIAEEKNRKQIVVTWTIGTALLIVLICLVFVFRSLRTTNKQKKIIESQKKLVEEHQKEIIDSINYAKRIQTALLRDEEHISMHLPEHFILFLPKDIVSGDFYWGAEKNDYWYFAVADCTGHGVPGAIMSMLGISFLNDIVSSEELLSPAEILNRLRDRIISELRQTGNDGGNKDGMDISLSRLNLKTKELEWAGANNALNLLQNGNLIEVKADKQPIGYHLIQHPFTNHTIQLQKGDRIYLFSDGYADQFGGPKEKKFSYKRLENEFIAASQLPMREQKILLKKGFTDWKGLLEQIDDVCVLGVKI